MKKQTTIQRALTLRKVSSARRKQRGFAMEWIIIVLLIAAALVPLVIYLSHTMQEKARTAGDAANASSQEELDKLSTDHQARNTELQGEGAKAQTTSEGLSAKGGASFDNSGEGGN